MAFEDTVVLPKDLTAKFAKAFPDNVYLETFVVIGDMKRIDSFLLWCIQEGAMTKAQVEVALAWCEFADAFCPEETPEEEDGDDDPFD